MKPPHWRCTSCKIIFTDYGSKPQSCSHCGGTGFVYLGYEGDYDSNDRMNDVYLEE